MTYSKFKKGNNQKKGGPVNPKFKKQNHQKHGGPGQPVRRTKSKLKVVFDQDSRTDYLTGFHKRKLAKKAKYRCMLERKVASEKQRIKEKMLNSSAKTSSSDYILPEVEELLRNDDNDFKMEEVEEYDVGSKTVVISTLNPSIKPTPNSVDEEIEEDAGVEDKEEENGVESGSSGVAGVVADRKLQSKLKKSANQMLQSSKFFKANQRLKTKKNKRKMQNRSRVDIEKSGKPRKTETKGKAKEKNKSSGGPGSFKKGGKRRSK